MRLLSIFSSKVNQPQGHLSLSDLKKSIGHFAGQKAKNQNPNSLSARFFKFVNETFGDYKNLPEDPKVDTLETVALRAIRMTRDNRSIDEIVDYTKSDDHLKTLLQQHDLSSEDLKSYVQENIDHLTHHDYLTRGGIYPPPTIQI